MRVFAAVALILLVVEAVLVLAFLAGYCWLDGWLAGVLLCALVLCLLILPWVGDLVVDGDSAAGRVTLHLSWWGRMTYRSKPKRELRVRLFGIPWRKRMIEREPKEEPEAERQARREARRRRGRAMIRWGRERPRESVRALLAGLEAALDLLWDARELRLEVGAPTQIAYADQAIAGAVGSRRLGPLQLTCSAAGDRQVAVRYRIGLLRAALTGLCVAAQAQPWKLRAAQREAESAAGHAERKEAD